MQTDADKKSVKILALDALHQSLGARMVDFAGYSMPVQYKQGVKAEHLHTRSNAGLFDVSHMGQLRIVASDGQRDTLTSQLEAALPLDFSDWPEGVQRYSVLMNAQGGIEDDLMLANLGNEVRMVVNAGNRDTDLALLRQLCPKLQVDWVDAALIALQGPRAETILQSFDPRAAQMRFMQVSTLNLDGAPCLTARSGYTGEDGYEISIEPDHAQRLVERLLADSYLQPIGLGARDTLRLEAGLPLHGNDISASTTPIEAGLPFAIARSRRAGQAKAGGFPGAGIVLDQLVHGTARKLSGFASFDKIPIRAGASIVNEFGQTVGEVTSGTLSPSLNHPVMLGYVESGTLNVDITPKLHAVVRTSKPVVVPTPLPFVPKRYKR